MDKVVVALDNFSKEDLKKFLGKYGSHFKTIKIGLELFNRYGRKYIEDISKKYELEVFLDLKLHDIPSTVYKAIRSLEGLSIKFLTIHLSGGEEMIKNAMFARDNYLPNTKLLGVTLLTSLNDEDISTIYHSETEAAFSGLYNLAKKTRIDGVVLSGHELSLARAIDHNYQHNTLKVCPGIRFEGDESVDQARVMAPKDAFHNGANYLVIGRSITENPKVLDNIQEYLQ